MNAQRHVVRNVWKGCSLAKQPSFIAHVGCNKDHEDRSVSPEDSPLLAWTKKLCGLSNTQAMYASW